MNPKEEECLESEPEVSEQSPPIPRPLEMSTVPAFLSKTFDIVDDALTDAVVSWGPTGASFVVWDPAEFSRLVLPRNFKHNNFSSFVRQLNTYGFRKVDADKWEFANKSFLRGNKHLLKNIQRRKSTQSQHMPIYFDPFSEEVMSLGLESEVERLREERTQMMKEVVELQKEQRGTASLVEGVKNRLQSAEVRQKQMVSFFAKMIQNPSFIAKLKEKEGSRLLGSPRSRRRFLTQQQSTQGFSNKQVGEGASSGETENTLSKGKGIMVPLEGNTDLSLDPEFYVSVPDDLNQDRSFLELSPTSVERIMKQEGVWDMGLGSSPGLYGGGSEFSDTQVNYEVPDLGITSEMLDIWDSGSLMVGGGSELDKWQAEISPFGDEPENEDSCSMPKSTDP